MYNLVEKIGEVNYYIVSNKYLLYKQSNDIIYQNKVIEKDVDDDEIAEIMQDALGITDNDSYEAITFITENSDIPYDTIQRVYKTFYGYY